MERHPKPLAALPQIVAEYCFYFITIMATINCLKRPDWNFAFGLLSYFMMKSIQGENYFTVEGKNVKLMLIVLNIGLLIFDIIWVFTLGSVWHGEPTHDKIIWEGFSTLHTVILTISVIIILTRIVAVIFLVWIQQTHNTQNIDHRDPHTLH